MKSQFTPGPWRTTGLNVRAGDALICYATNHWADDETPESERQANANLIAAAPELLAVLRQLLREFQRVSYDYSGTQAKALAVIAKAKGREKQ
jgi:hypothetical protein